MEAMTEEKTTKRHYPPEFKLQVARAAEGAGGIPAAARKFGLPENNVERWFMMLKAFGPEEFARRDEMRRGPRIHQTGNAELAKRLAALEAWAADRGYEIDQYPQ